MQDRTVEPPRDVGHVAGVAWHPHDENTLLVAGNYGRSVSDGLILFYSFHWTLCAYSVIFLRFVIIINQFLYPRFACWQVSDRLTLNCSVRHCLVWAGGKNRVNNSNVHIVGLIMLLMMIL